MRPCKTCSALTLFCEENSFARAGAMHNGCMAWLHGFTVLSLLTPRFSGTVPGFGEGKGMRLVSEGERSAEGERSPPRGW